MTSFYNKYFIMSLYYSKIKLKDYNIILTGITF